MKKEVVIAIFIGTILGLGGAFGIWKMAASYLSKPKTNTNQQGKFPTPIGQSTTTNTNTKSTINITLAAIEPFDVLNQSPTNISGATINNSIVVAYTSDNIKILRSNNSGIFEGQFELSAGLNYLKFDVFKDTQKSTSEYPVVFSSEFTGSTTPASSKDATSSSDIREKVQEKLQANSKRATSFIGAVTDLTDSSIQVKNTQGQIQQIKLLTDVTVFVKNTGKNTSEIKRSDVAIGDFIIAMGYKDQDQTLQARRILVTTEPQKNTNIVTYGKIESVDTKNIIVSLKNSSEKITIDLSKKPKITNEKNDKTILSKSIAVSQEVIVFNTNRIFVLDTPTN